MRPMPLFVRAVAGFALVSACACGGGDGGTDGRSDGIVADVATVDPGPSDPGSGDLPDARDPGATTDPGADPGFDPGATDLPGEPGPDAGEDTAADVPADTGPVPGSCRSFDDCADGEVCLFSEGRCEGRSTWTDPAMGLYGFHPRAAGPGDVLVIDGKRFVAGMFPTLSVSIGAVTLSGFTLDAGENRILIDVTAAMSGSIQVKDTGGQGGVFLTPFAQAPAGVLPCDGSTPAATGVPGTRPVDAGPHAAGYVDLGDATRTRVFYPAQCGSIRRPPVPGTWPVVAMLHGNGAQHLNYEYLAELLATWGFVSFVPATQQNMAGEDFQKMLEELMPVVTKMRGRPLGDVHPVLSGVTTTADIAFVGHSRGTGRTEEVYGAEPDVKAHAVANVFLGPVDDGEVVPGYFLVFGGGKDAQSTPGNYNGCFNRQPRPRGIVYFPGGNHGSFCDHKVYGYGLVGMLGDAQPSISRHRQLAVVQAYVLPLFQRAFGLAEPFATQLDDPPDAPDHTTTFEW